MDRGLARIHQLFGYMKKNLRKHRAVLDDDFYVEFERGLRLLNDSIVLKKIEVEVHEESRE